MSQEVQLQHTPQLLATYLKTLRLPARLRECDPVARQSAQQDATYELFLQQLTELEVQQRQAASIARRLKQAGFPVVKELSEFDFTAAPKLNKKRMLDLAQCRFVDQRSNLVLNGAPARARPTWRSRWDARPAGVATRCTSTPLHAWPTSTRKHVRSGNCCGWSGRFRPAT